MAEERWKIYISYRKNERYGTNAIGLRAASLADIEKFAEITGLPIVSGESGAVLDVDLAADSIELKKLLAEIESLYGFVPSKGRIPPRAVRHRVFGLHRVRVYSDAEIDASEYLYVSSGGKEIAESERGTAEDVAKERYVVEKQWRQKKDVQLGFISPFPICAVSRQPSIHASATGRLSTRSSSRTSPVSRPRPPRNHSLQCPDAMPLAQDEPREVAG